MPDHLTRRQLLQGATLAIVAPAGLVATEKVAVAAEPAIAATRTAFENLTASESGLLDAIVERLIPSDDHGPGAKEARVAYYIDRALGGALASSREAYAAGLAALDRYASASRGKPFRELPPVDQDSVLIDCETGAARGFTGSSAQFFAMLLSHTRQGMFGDPYYGGNANYVGWDLIGYPGVRTSVSAADQKALEASTLTPVRKSAYEYAGFNKATASTTAEDPEDMSRLAGVTHHGN